MKQTSRPPTAPDTAAVPNDKPRIRWSAPSAASDLHRPTLMFVSRARDRQKLVGLSWVGLIR